MPTIQFTPTVVYHPAETLREKLSEMGMSIKEFALRTGIPEKTFIAVLNEESSLTPEMAVLFENVTKHLLLSGLTNKPDTTNSLQEKTGSTQFCSETQNLHP